MKLLGQKEIRRLEEQAALAGVSLEQLMENAGLALAHEILHRLEPAAGKRALLLCGRGNNGGDGFVCARALLSHDMEAAVLLVQGEPETGLAKAAFSRLPPKVAVWRREEADCEALMREAEVIVDAVFGFGFHGALPPELSALFSAAERCGALRLSADLPSGCCCDTGEADGGSFRADVTVTFTAPKPACSSYPAKEYCGETVVSDVGIPAALTEKAESLLFETDAFYAAARLNRPAVQSNKGDLGRLLLVCGSYGMAGACVMAARAALRSGVGLVEIAVEKELYPIIAPAVPEAVITVLDGKQPEEADDWLRAALRRCSACLVGCGLGERAEQLCPIVLAHCEGPLVLDADALNFLSRHPETKLPANCVLTPHPGEMSRLSGMPVREIQQNRLAAAGREAAARNAVLVLKGAGTVTAAPTGACALNPTGNAGMAKGGSGDVLAGIIGSLLAQGLAPFEAAAVGAYVHGRAGDLCAARLTQRSMLPTDLTEALPLAFAEIKA